MPVYSIPQVSSLFYLFFYSMGTTHLFVRQYIQIHLGWNQRKVQDGFSNRTILRGSSPTGQESTKGYKKCFSLTLQINGWCVTCDVMQRRIIWASTTSMLFCSLVMPLWRPCNIRETSMSCQCDTHVMPMWCPWDTHVMLMWRPCGTHVMPMWCPCDAHVTLMWHPCEAHETPMWSPCDAHVTNTSHVQEICPGIRLYEQAKLKSSLLKLYFFNKKIVL